MEALQHKIQPKFVTLGRHFADRLSAHGTDEFFPHVARHAEEQLIHQRIAGLHLHLQNEVIRHYRIFKSVYGEHIFLLF